MPEAVIVDTIRTPIGRAFKGSLAQLRPDEMGAYVVDRLLERNPEVDPALIEDVFCGVGMPQGLQAFNLARIVSLLSEKLPRMPSSRLLKTQGFCFIPRCLCWSRSMPVRT